MFTFFLPYPFSSLVPLLSKGSPLYTQTPKHYHLSLRTWYAPSYASFLIVFLFLQSLIFNIPPLNYNSLIFIYLSKGYPQSHLHPSYAHLYLTKAAFLDLTKAALHSNLYSSLVITLSEHFYSYSSQFMIYPFLFIFYPLNPLLYPIVLYVLNH